MTFLKMVEFIRKKSKVRRIIVMGLDNAGKSSVLNAIFHFDTTVSPTFGYRIYNSNHNNNELVIMDIGGQTSFQDHWSNYFEKVDGVLFIFDCSDNRDFSSYLKPLLRLDVPVAIASNKTDLNCNVSAENRIKLCVEPENRVKLFETSIFDVKSIEKVFDWLLSHSC